MARAFPRVACFALLLVGCLVTAAVISWLRVNSSDKETQQSPKGPLAQAENRLHNGGAEPTGPEATFHLTEQQQRGKQFYSTGVSVTGGTTAVLGDSISEIPASALKCVNCHLQDGRGKPEGGILPSNICWDELTKPYGSRIAPGRNRPPYDALLLKRAITMGLDSSGRSLDHAMPRYRMTNSDLADLVSYLMVLGRELDPGLSAHRVRIGVILPPSQRFPEMNQAMRAALAAFVSEFNRAGGVYHREIDLRFTESPARREDRSEAAIEFVKREQVFALATSFIAGAEADIARRLDEEGVPLIGAQTLYPQMDFPLNRHVFYLTSGLQAQCRALIRFARDRRLNNRQSAVLLFSQDKEHSDEGNANAGLAVVANSIKTSCSELGWKLQQLPAPPKGIDQRLVETRSSVIFSLLTGEQNVRFLKSAAANDWYPTCFLLGDLAGRELFEAPAGFDRRLFLSFGSLPSQLPFGIRAHSKLADEFKLPTTQLAAQFETLAAMTTLVQALQQAGTRLSRDRLIEQLETFHEYRTGFAPPITFGPNRRLGANGSYVVTLDLTNKKLVSVSDWVEAPVPSHAD